MRRRQFLIGTGAMLGVLAAAVPVTNAAATTVPKLRLLRARRGRAQMLPVNEPMTAIWGYEGSTPGPVLTAKQGAPFHLQLLNELPQATTIHWHGIRIDNRMDGVAGLTQEAVPPGERFDYSFVPPDAGTYWYHPHNRSWEQVARGLYGAFVVAEPTPPVVDRDIVAVVDDWRLDERGQIHHQSFGSLRDAAHAGRLGNVLTINGQDIFRLDVKAGERMRLRLINAANARILTLRVDRHSATIVALDGQPVAPRKVPDATVALAPGQRADLMLDMTLDPGSTAAIEAIVNGRNGPEALVIGNLVYGATPLRSQPLDRPVTLPNNPLPARPDPASLAAAKRVDLVMEGGAMGQLATAIFKGKSMDVRELAAAGQAWAFNGVAGRSAKPLFDVARGRAVTVAMDNQTNWPHAMHFHGHHVIEVERADSAGRPIPFDEAWRDTILVDPGARVTVAFIADNPGKWMLHCHMLEHQAAGMATWFNVQA